VGARSAPGSPLIAPMHLLHLLLIDFTFVAKVIRSRVIVPIQALSLRRVCNFTFAGTSAFRF